MTVDALDLGNGFSLHFTSWKPDRELNPQYDGLCDLDVVGAIVTCRHGSQGSILFDVSEAHTSRLWPGRPVWKVVSWYPLTLSPSIDAGCCHGHIRQGRWVD